MAEIFVASEHALYAFMLAYYSCENGIPERNIVGHLEFALAFVVAVDCGSRYGTENFIKARIEFRQSAAVFHKQGRHIRILTHGFANAVLFQAGIGFKGTPGSGSERHAVQFEK